MSSLALAVDSYIYKIVPVESYIAAISSDDSLRLVDRTSLREISRPPFSQLHIGGVTCLETLENDKYSLCTAGRDAVVRLWDSRLGQNTLEFGDDSKAPYLSLCNSDHYFVVGTELSHSQASVILWDHRAPVKPVRQYVDSHNDDITVVQFHPYSGRTILSGSTDGLVNIYDTAQSDEDDALFQIANHGSSINHAAFLSESQFFAISHDEKFSVYQLRKEDDPAADIPPQVFGDLRPELECEYVVDILPSIGGGEAIFGAGSHSKQYLDVIPAHFAEKWTFDMDSMIRLLGAHGEDIVRSMLVDHQAQALFTAGEDGFIRAWLRATTTTTGRAEQHMQETDQNTTIRRKKKKNSVGGEGSKASRFKPY